MKPLVNHPGMWLRDDAADSLQRLEHDHGVQPVNSAGRTVAEQDRLIYRYAHPSGPQDRPPYLFAPAPSSGPNKSRHIDGKAVDADTVATDRAMWAEYGFEFLFPYDKIHVEYNPATDKHINDNVVVIKPSTIKPINIKEDNMFILIPVLNNSGSTTVKAFNLRTLKSANIPGKDKDVDYLSLTKRFLNNDGSDTLNAREVDIVTGILSKTL